MSWLLALLSRIALLCVWIGTPLVSQTFHHNWLLPLLGILLLPITTLSYILVSALSEHGVTGWAWFWVLLAFLVDLAAHKYPTRKALQASKSKQDMLSRPQSREF